MPQEYISDRQSLTVCGFSTFPPVFGQMPAFASVAAITDNASVVVSIYRHEKKKSV